MDVQQGVYVTLSGMALVFASLIVIMLLIMALDRIFRPRASAAEPVIVAPDIPASEADESAAIAAIAVALALARLTLQEGPRPRAPQVHVLALRRRASGWRVAERMRKIG